MNGINPVWDMNSGRIPSFSPWKIPRLSAFFFTTKRIKTLTLLCRANLHRYPGLRPHAGYNVPLHSTRTHLEAWHRFAPGFENDSESRHRLATILHSRRQNEKVLVAPGTTGTALVRGGPGFLILRFTEQPRTNQYFTRHLARRWHGRQNVLSTRHVLGLGTV